MARSKEVEKLPVYLVRVVTKDDYVIEKEIQAHNEYDAVLEHASQIEYDMDLFYRDKAYSVTDVVQVD